MANNIGNSGNNGTASLQGKVALVTGAGRGIGRAIALELARRGANVALDYRSDASHAESARDEIQKLGVECIAIKGDVSKKGEAARIVKEVLDKWQRLDILVNNAGITRDRSMRKMTDDDWAEVINVNLNGTFYCTSASLPPMINQRYGRIINIASVVGQMGAFGQANYSASKGGIIAFTKTLALEMAKFNITANSIAPGFTSTEMVDAIPEEIAAQIKAKIPLGRFATTEEIAKAAGFLAADADYIRSDSPRRKWSTLFPRRSRLRSRRRFPWDALPRRKRSRKRPASWRRMPITSDRIHLDGNGRRYSRGDRGSDQGEDSLGTLCHDGRDRESGRLPGGGCRLHQIGFTSTEMVDAIPEEIAAQIKAKIPLGRFATTEEIAKAAGFLAADADYITA